MIQISDVRLTPGSEADRATGLLGFLRCRVAEQLLIDGIALRRARGGDLILSFPCRRDRQGRDHALVRPLDADARATIEAQIFAALRDQGALP